MGGSIHLHPVAKSEASLSIWGVAGKSVFWVFGHGRLEGTKARFGGGNTQWRGNKKCGMKGKNGRSRRWRLWLLEVCQNAST